MKVKDIVVNEATLGAYIPGKSAVIKDPTKGIEYNLDLTKPENMAALKPNDKGELEYDPTPELGAQAATTEPKLAPGAEVTIKADEELPAASTLPPEQLEYNKLRAQVDSLTSLQGDTGTDTYSSQDPELVARQNAMRQKLAGMEAALKAKGIDARAEYDAPEPGTEPAAPVDLAQKYGRTNETRLARESAELESMLRIAGLR